MIQQASFPSESQEDRHISTGTGFAIERLGKGYLSVHRYGIPYKTFHIQETLDRGVCWQSRCWNAGSLKAVWHRRLLFLGTALVTG